MALRKRMAKEKGKGKGRSRSPNAQPPPIIKDVPGQRTGQSPSGKKDVNTCFNDIKGICKNGDKCNYYHVPICKFFKKGKESKAGKECRFLHRNDIAKPKAILCRAKDPSMSMFKESRSPLSYEEWSAKR